jgi:hypothetical protein
MGLLTKGFETGQIHSTQLKQGRPLYEMSRAAPANSPVLADTSSIASMRGEWRQ